MALSQRDEMTCIIKALCSYGHAMGLRGSFHFNSLLTREKYMVSHTWKYKYFTCLKNYNCQSLKPL